MELLAVLLVVYLLFGAGYACGEVARCKNGETTLGKLLVWVATYVGWPVFLGLKLGEWNNE